MARIDPVPRRTVMVEKGLVSTDWDRWLQSVQTALNAAQSNGVFANNAAAVAGGLVIGQVYQTVTGELRVVV
jgi:hypothetical protein